MEIYQKGELDPYSLFSQSDQCGLVIPGTTNLFVKYKKEPKTKDDKDKKSDKDDIDLHPDENKIAKAALVSKLKRKATNIGENVEGEDKKLNYEIFHANLGIVSKGEDT